MWVWVRKVGHPVELRPWKTSLWKVFVFSNEYIKCESQMTVKSTGYLNILDGVKTLLLQILKIVLEGCSKEMIYVNCSVPGWIM